MKKIFALVGLLVACSGGVDDPEEYTPPQRQPTNECALTPGDYVIDWSTVSDTCEAGELPSELLTILSNGSSATPAEPPDGCFDGPVQESGCTRSFQRECIFDVPGAVLTVNYSFTFNSAQKTGTVNIQGRVEDANTGAFLEACSTAARATISRLN